MLGDITVLEPMTAVTDFIVTAVCLLAFVRLRRLSKANGGYMSYYPYFFLTMGLGCFFAALMTHAFAYTMVDILPKDHIRQLDWAGQLAYHLHDLPNWIFNIVSVTLFEFAMLERISQLKPNYNRNLYTGIVIAESAVVLMLLLWKLNYAFAAMHIGFALYIIELPHIWPLYRSTGNPEARYLVIASLVMLPSGVAMAMQQWLVENSPWFNHNDISHCLIAITMYLCYKSAEIGIRNGIHTIETPSGCR